MPLTIVFLKSTQRNRPDITIVQVYPQTLTTEEENIDSFTLRYKKTLQKLHSENIQIIMSDFLAKVGTERKQE